MQYNRIDIYKPADFDKKEQELKISYSDIHYIIKL